VNERPRDAHYPGRAAIDAYGRGGFSFAGMSHRGSILALPSGIWAWTPASAAEIDAAHLTRVVAEAEMIDLLFVGTGPDIVVLPEPVRRHLRDGGIRFETLATAGAASSYNILLAEGRRVAAALIAVP
jgi:uncharacterized protein